MSHVYQQKSDILLWESIEKAHPTLWIFIVSVNFLGLILQVIITLDQ